MKSALRTIRALACLGALIWGSASLAHPPGPADPDPAAGVSFGGGVVACDGCSGGAAGVEAHLGGKISSDLIVLGDVWFMGDLGGATQANQLLVTGAVQFWPAVRFWLRLGGGLGRAAIDVAPSGAGDKSAIVPALHAGLGVELISDPDFALDLQLLYGQGFHSDPDLEMSNVQLGLGLNWY